MSGNIDEIASALFPTMAKQAQQEKPFEVSLRRRNESDDPPEERDPRGQVDEDAAAQVRAVAKREKKHPVVVSALTGEGVSDLLDEIEARVSAGRATMDIELDASDGEGLHWLYEHTEVLDRSDGAEGSLKLRVRVPPERAEGVRRRFAVP